MDIDIDVETAIMIRLAGMKGRLGNAMNTLASKMKVKADFHNVVGQVCRSILVLKILEPHCQHASSVNKKRLFATNAPRWHDAMQTRLARAG